MLRDTARPRIGNSGHVATAQAWRVLARRLVDRWRRYRERCALLDLDDRLLRDIGLSRDDARREAAMRFWARREATKRFWE